MFGYVTICKNTLDEQDYNTFKAYYCGLCKAIGKRCSQGARMGLSYDITFLAVVLSSVEKGETKMHSGACLLHPSKKKEYASDERALDYAADMGVILSYLKLLDDWHDDKSLKALSGLFLFRRAAKKASRRYPETYTAVKQCLQNLSKLEKAKCAQIDETADCFAKILEILFTPSFVEDENQKRILAWLGYNIGRWIYIIDAYNDLEKDVKNGSYNTFVCKCPNKTADEIKKEIRENLELSLLLTLENAASAYDLLTIYKNKGILDNIMYTALKQKQTKILGEKNESL
jgi:hypothetical protein